jgi:hypothetical protein
LDIWRALFHEFRFTEHLGGWGGLAWPVRAAFEHIHHDWCWEAWGARAARLLGEQFFRRGVAFNLALVDELFALDRPQEESGPRLLRAGIHNTWAEPLPEIPSTVRQLVTGPLRGTAKTLDAVWRSPTDDPELLAFRALDPRPDWRFDAPSPSELRRLARKAAAFQVRVVAALAPRATRVVIGAQRRRLKMAIARR